MSSRQEDAGIGIARRIADALAVGDHEAAIRLTRELKSALTNTPVPTADEGPSVSAQPAVVAKAHRPAPHLDP